jgi:hypothetical protein
MIQTLLLLGLFGLPVAVGVILIAFADPTQSRMGLPAGTTRRVLMGTAGITALCAILLQLIDPTVTVQFTWLSGTGPMTLSLGASSLLAAAATAVALTLTAGLVDVPTGLTGGVMLLALAAGNVAFLAGHFLLRYVALEVVGLIIAAAPLIEARDRRAGAHAAWVYLLLRVGDAGLLTAILVLWAQTGTLAIGPALLAGAELPTGVRAWVVGGFFLAVAVKIGLWPFHAWIHSGERLNRPAGAWLYATLMPNLGLYLLYRVMPLTVGRPGLRWGLIGLGIAAGGATLLAAFRRPDRRRRPFRILAGGMALIWCAAIGLQGRIAWWGLLALSVARLPLLLRRLPSPSPQAWAPVDTGVRQFARRVRADVQVGILERGLSTMVAGLSRVSTWLHDRVERGILERGLSQGAGTMIHGARRLYDRVEQEGLEGGLRELTHTMLHASHHLRLWHGGKLRINLGWVALCLIVAMVVALLV